MSEKLGLGLISSSAVIRKEANLLLCSLTVCSMISSLLWLKHLWHLYLLLIIISVTISPSLIHLVRSSLSQPLPWNWKLEILLLPSNKAHGLYSCPVRVLKSSSSELSLPLAQIMNISVTTGLYPSKLKHAKVIPIFKGGDETDPYPDSFE